MSSQSAVLKPFVPGETVGSYTIVRLLPSGDGGQARVYEALQAGTQRRVALKVALSGKASFLRDEASFMRAFKLHHPNIIQLVPTPIMGGMEEHVLRDPRSNAWYFAMEYLPGGSLADCLDRHKKLPVGTAVEIARQVALALDVAHSAGLVHLDVKPNNVLFRQPPEKAHKIEVVLTDFGISRPQVNITSGTEDTSLTVEYASPEQARLAQEPTDDAAAPDPGADIPVGPRSDLYSLATILYQMITGHLPLHLLPSSDESDDQANLNKVVHDPPELPIPGIPSDLNTILARALHKDPEARHPSARAFAEDLSRLSIKPAPFPGRERRASRWLVGLVGLIVGLTIGFVIGQATAGPINLPIPTVSSIPPSLTPSRATNTPEPDTPTPSPTNTLVSPTSTLRPTGTPTLISRIAPPVAAQ